MSPLSVLGAIKSFIGTNRYDTPKVAFKMSDPPKLVVLDYIDKLPNHPTRIYSIRDIKKVNSIILHQSATDATVEQIAHFHVTPSPDNHLSPQGAPRIAYHFAIRKNGEVLQCNKLTDISWHCKNYNSNSIGILVNGDFHGSYGWKGACDPTLEQMKSVRLLLNYLFNLLKLPKDCLQPHSFYDPQNRKNDPGTVLESFILEYKGVGSNYNIG